jgi:hypothetical protein
MSTKTHFYALNCLNTETAMASVAVGTYALVEMGHRRVRKDAGYNFHGTEGCIIDSH